jgi:hypothetical protein
MSLKRILAYAPTGLLLAALLAIVFIPHDVIAPIPVVNAHFKRVATELWPPSRRLHPEAHAISVDVQLSDGSTPLVSGGPADPQAFKDIATKECAQLLKTIANTCRLEHIYFTGGAQSRGLQVFARYLVEPKTMKAPAH